MLGRIALHHIGGRNGSRVFPLLKTFEKDFVNVLYDADKDCIEHIKEQNPQAGFKTYVLPYCLGRSNGQAEFNLNYDPYTSSLLKTNAAFSRCYQFCGNLDSVWEEASRTMRSVTVEVFALDSILGARSDLPKPDFLSIDTQGSEYDILLGAKGLLEKDILGLMVEVEFKELYKGQALFGDTQELLLSRGFEFIKFSHIGEIAPYRAPIGLRAEGEQVFADALFLKKHDLIGSSTREDYIKLRKLAFFSIAFNQLERGFLYLERSKETQVSRQALSQLQGLSYLRFLEELERRVSFMKKQFPVTFSDVYSYEESRSRFDSSTRMAKRSSGIYDRLVYALKKNRVLYKILRGIRDILIGAVAWLNYNSRLLLSPRTPVETLFYEYGLRGLAKKVRLNRIYQATHVKLKNNKKLGSSKK